MRPEDERYFEGLESRLDEAMAVATRARERGGDPTEDVEIPIAKDMADRVENILGIPGVADRVRGMEADPDISREEAALELARSFAEGEVGDYDTRAGKVEGAVRTAVALLTEGVVAAPIEGIDRVEVLENDDGTECVRVYYAGPIRSAGGTAQALSVLVADYTRTLVGLEEYKPREDEVERYVEEIDLYDKETGLQYTPKDEETRFIAQNSPVMLDGEATGEEGVSGYRDLERVDTNSARGGMCLVLGEGIAQKAPKIERYTSQLEEVDWPWLDDLIEGRVGKDPGGDGNDAGEGPEPDAASVDDGNGTADPGDPATEPGPEADADEPEPAGPVRPEPATKFLRDLIAGRPVFGHPSRPGGFRLRYGRARNHGFATAGVHPATMHVVDDFLATGTQLKTERPGKAAGVVPVDSIEGPTVRLANGDVRRIDDPEEAEELRNGVDAVLDLGEYLVNYGEFVENNHPLAPASYTVEWWVEDLAAAGADLQAMRDDPHVDLGSPDPGAALRWATEYDAPLHPAYTYLWHDLTVEAFDALADAAANGNWAETDGASERLRAPRGTDRIGGDTDDGHTLVLPRTEGTVEALETLLVEHHQGDGTVTIPDALPLVRSLGLTAGLDRTWTLGDLSTAAREWAVEGDPPGSNAVRAVNEVAPFSVRERAPTRIGSRMGRPEKSERRDLSPAVHTLFPIGEAGGSQRDVAAAAKYAPDRRSTPGHVEVQVGRRACSECATQTFLARCPECNGVTVPRYVCRDCDITVAPDESGRAVCPRCEAEADAVENRTIDVNDEYRSALGNVREREAAFDQLKGVKGLTSASKVPEPMEKGILRAKHGVSTFKDGTVRYDMTDLPVTSVRPEELGVTADHFRELGYTEDVHGQPLRHDDQLVELKVQDVVLSDGAAEHMLRTADFVDDLLAQYYGLEPFYEAEDRDDLVGELVFGMAPHTSAAVVGRVVGFTSAAVGYAHPYFHAAKRRNCFHPETKLRYEDGDGWHEVSIERFVEARLDEDTADTDDFGTLVTELDGAVRVPSVTGDGEKVLKPVEAVSKHVSPDHHVRVETHGGRSLIVTPEHELLRWDEGIERVPASEVEPGMCLPVSTQWGEAGGATRSSPAVTDGGSTLDTVSDVSLVESDTEHVYCVTVPETHTLAVNGVLAAQCDGDEDCVMLLMDGLLNFSKSYLPDQRGGSVAEDSRLVAFGPDGETRFLTFEAFWDELESPVEHDGKFQKRACLSEGWKTYAFEENHDAAPRPIEKAIRYPAGEDEQLLRVSTQFGRSVDITANHSLFRYENGIEEVAGDDLSEGDLILAPRSLPVDSEATTLDAAELVDEPYVVIDDRAEDLLRTVRASTERGSEAHAAFESGLSDRLSKDKIPYGRLERILEHGGLAVPDDSKIAPWGSTNGVRRRIEVDEEFAWLLGLFVAEGSTSSVPPAISNADEALIERAAAVTRETLGVDPHVRWSNRAYELQFPAVFREVLYGLGFADEDSYDSSEKVIPDAVLRAPDDVARSFLRGFIAGDGSDTIDDNVTTVSFHTTSEDVKDGLVFLLHRFGVVANVSHRERDETRQPIYTVTTPGGADDNPLHRVLDGEEPSLPKSLVVRIPDALMDLRGMDIQGVKQVVPKYRKRGENVSLEKLREMIERIERRELPAGATEKLDELRPLVDGDLSYLRVTDVERVDYDGYLYDLQVGGDPVFTTNWLYAHNSMDAPLVMSSRIDPTEIDDEAHNMDVVERYPRAFYEATLRMTEPDEVDVEIAEASLGTETEYTGFRHTHDTSDIALGPDLSAYKTLGDMQKKMDGQLDLARKIRAVDETDVAERIIEYHFLPDLIGNLRAFSRQETRCLDCGEKYRRMPLTGDCRECGGNVNLTVHRGSVDKYMQTARTVAEEFGCREYTKQRLEILERSLESIFEDDTNKQSGIADFM
ncbi:DNA polymerase II large subunit [Halobacteriales archaeon QS_5_70_15]|nr:MAG: DNA polymerase II large subunit [Halobacteriales archaeon QS_5_70_15]